MSLMRSARRITAPFLALSMALHPVLHAADDLPLPDLIPPEIRHAPLAEIPAGMPLRIQATVTDDVGVAEVTLLYRGTGDVEYQRMKMLRTPGTDRYSADMPDTTGPRIEYFIQASDVSGNAVLGQLFDPYVTIAARKPVDGGIMAPQAAVATAGAPAPESYGGISRWVWIGLGIAALAAVAGSTAGGGGGSNTGNNGGNGGSTGTVTITAPIP